MTIVDLAKSFAWMVRLPLLYSSSQNASKQIIVKKNVHAKPTISNFFVRWEAEKKAFYEFSENEKEDIVALEFKILTVLYEREICITRFMLEEPTGRVVQERGFTSIGIFMQAYKDLFATSMFKHIMSHVFMLSNFEDGAIRCLLNVEEGRGNERTMIKRSDNLGGVDINEDYLCQVAQAYRDRKESFDHVINAFEDNVLAELFTLISRLG